MLSSILPKNKRKHKKIRPNSTMMSNFFHSFFSRIEDTIICFRDLLTFNLWLQSLKPHNPVDIKQQPLLRLHRSIVLLQFRELVEIARILFQLCALSPLTQNSKNSSNCSEQQCAVPYFDEKKEQSKKIRQIPTHKFVLIRFLFRSQESRPDQIYDPMTKGATPLLNQAVHHLHLDSIGATSLPN
jgi:hypothetical protein